MTHLILFLALQTAAVPAQPTANQLCATNPDRCEMQTSGNFIVSSGTIINDSLMSCGSNVDGTVKDCKIAEGHTLDEVINYLLKSHWAQYDRDQAEKKAILDAWDKSLRDIEDILTPKLVIPQVKRDDDPNWCNTCTPDRACTLMACAPRALKHPRRVYSCKRHPEKCKTLTHH